eukprot:SAG22_NODE_814_length_7044_cov_24.348884_8_plen_130_part_00
MEEEPPGKEWKDGRQCRSAATKGTELSVSKTVHFLRKTVEAQQKGGAFACSAHLEPGDPAGLGLVAAALQGQTGRQTARKGTVLDRTPVGAQAERQGLTTVRTGGPSSRLGGLVIHLPISRKPYCNIII